MNELKCAERQESLKWHIKEEYYLFESDWDFSDCDDFHDVADAVCKLLIDNYDVGHNGSYIKELIQIACYKSAQIGVVE
jgi:hypothetical protein